MREEEAWATRYQLGGVQKREAWEGRGSTLVGLDLLRSGHLPFEVCVPAL